MKVKCHPVGSASSLMQYFNFSTDSNRQMEVCVRLERIVRPPFELSGRKIRILHTHLCIRISQLFNRLQF